MHVFGCFGGKLTGARKRLCVSHSGSKPRLTGWSLVPAGEGLRGLFWLKHLHDVVLIAPQPQLLPLLSLGLSKGMGNVKGPGLEVCRQAPFSSRKCLLASQDVNAWPEGRWNSLLHLPLWIEHPPVFGERTRMGCWLLPQEGRSGLSAHTSGLAGHFQLPLSSWLWLSHPDGCFSGGCTFTRVWAGNWP